MDRGLVESCFAPAAMKALESFSVDIPVTGEQRYAGMTTRLEGTLLSDYLEMRSDWR